MLSSASLVLRSTPRKPPPLSLSPSRTSRFRRPLRMHYIDAAPPCDTEFKLPIAHMNSTAASSGTSPNPLKISIIGLGQFHQEVPQDLAFSETETKLVDVHSTKGYSKNMMHKVLPADFDIICSHPMFGPESAELGWKGLFFVYEKVRIGNEDSRVSRCEKFLGIFAREKCAMVEMSCAEHDKYAAGSQFITHTVGRVLKTSNLESTPINTKGYEKLLDLVEDTAYDSSDLYYGLFMYNKNSLAMLMSFSSAIYRGSNELFERLDNISRKQQYESDEKVDILMDHRLMRLRRIVMVWL